jgi:DNA invertase Pin-like site-specific DNA recombinase
MFTIIGAMAELESSLISEPRHLGRPPVPARTVREIEALAASTELSVRQIQRAIAGKASRGVVGEITKRVRAAPSPAL